MDIVMLADLFGYNEVFFLINLILCVAIGFAVGYERESRGKDAGISTHILVIMGSALFTQLSVLIDPGEPARIASNIVVGIGFLGAGLIMRDGGSVRNLTTAASVWYSAAIGMAIGSGFHFIAFVAGITAVLVPRIPHLDKWSGSKKKGADDVKIVPQK